MRRFLFLIINKCKVFKKMMYTSYKLSKMESGILKIDGDI